MNVNERRVVVYKAFEDQLKAAKKALDELFRDRIRDWVGRFKDKSTVAEGCVKAFIRPVAEHDELDFESAGADFLKAAAKGLFTLPELLAMIEDGRLVAGDVGRIARDLEAKGVRKTYMIRVPAGYTEELRFNVTEKGRFEGLSASLKDSVDLEGAIRKAAEDLDKPPAGTVQIPGLKKSKV